MRAVRHLGCRKWKLLLLPWGLPSGITRGYAWCVPTGDIIIAFENTIRLSVHILIVSVHILIVSASALIASASTLIVSASTLIVSASALIASASALIA